MIGPVTISFGIATTVVVVLSAATRNRMAIWLSAMLAAGWVAYTVLGIFLPAPARYEPLPLTDLGCLAICAAFALAHRRDYWISALAVSFMVQILLHLAFLTNWFSLPEGDEWGRYWLETGYVFGLNATYAIQLLCVAWPGVRHVVEAYRRPDLGVLRPGGRVHS